MSKIFVFGSNTQGRHGKGAALYAKNNYGAIYGQSRGRQGNSYAIVTKDISTPNSVVLLSDIAKDVEDFIVYAKEHPELSFIITKIGCGLAGFDEYQIAPMFKSAPINCELPIGWR